VIMPAPVRTRRIAPWAAAILERAATPTAAPVCCMVWSIPDAAPASARGTPARIVTLSGKKHERPDAEEHERSEQALEIASDAWPSRSRASPRRA